jgi:GAF domain-containing protein
VTVAAARTRMAGVTTTDFSELVGGTTQLFLELLAREAAAVEFQGPLVRARAGGMDAETLGHLEAVTVAALRVRALLERRRRREEELSGLFDTANDLAGLRDLDAVLHAIVHRARTLLGTDTTYMTLHDEDAEDTYMRVTDGSISARFQALRLPMGKGLGGLVALTGAPYATADYSADPRFRHTGEIDLGVEEEGLVAILGVPMRLGQRVIGVLFAANRSARPFAPEEVSLLGSLAAHAAVAIDTARLLEETREALDELSAANTVIRAHSDAIERAAAAHDRMNAVVLSGGGVEEVAAAVAEVLGGGLIVLDSDGRQLAKVASGTVSSGAVSGTGSAANLSGTVSTSRMVEPSPAEIGEAVAASRAERRTVRRGRWWLAAVVAGNENLGALLLQPNNAQVNADLSEADQRILERAAVVTALLLLFRRSVADAEGRVRGDLLDELVSHAVRDAEAVRTRAHRLGIELDAPYILVCVGDEHLSGSLRQRAYSWAMSHAAAQAGLATSRDRRLVFLLPGTDAGHAARVISRDLGRVLGRPVTAGAAGPTGSADDVAIAYRDADRALAALAALGRTGDGASTAELGFVGLLLGEGRDVDGFLASTVGPVVDYDQRRGTALVQTLEAYFGCGGSLSRAAEILHVHVNTVTQRLDRVAQLLGIDWQKPDRALEVQLALRLHRLKG